MAPASYPLDLLCVTPLTATISLMNSISRSHYPIPIFLQAEIINYSVYLTLLP